MSFWALCRWLKPLTKITAVPSKELPEEAESAGRDENSAAAANTRQEAGATKQAHQEPAAHLCAEHPFIKAVASAAALAKVSRPRALKFISSCAQPIVLLVRGVDVVGHVHQ